MKPRILFATVILVSGLAAGGLTPVLADSTKANCGVSKNNDYRPKASGNCSFSQSQGYIDLKLANGHTYSLTPGNKPNHFKDDQGEKVVRTQSVGDEQIFLWDNGRQIVVTFDGGSSGHNQGGNQGHDKVAVRDMSRYCIGEAAGKFDRNPQDINAQDAVKDGSRYYVVHGNYPNKSSMQDFHCTFMADGHYVGIEKN